MFQYKNSVCLSNFFPPHHAGENRNWSTIFSWKISTVGCQRKEGFYINTCCWLDSASSGWGQIVEFCEHGSIQVGSCLTGKQKLWYRKPQTSINMVSALACDVIYLGSAYTGCPGKRYTKIHAYVLLPKSFMTLWIRNREYLWDG
jgi:hypothetical protein